MIGIDDEISLAARGEPTTLRRLAKEGRLTLRHFGSGAATGAAQPPTAFWVDVIHLSEPSATEGCSVTENVYGELLAMGVPETSN
jgi:hypothetical protein